MKSSCFSFSYPDAPGIASLASGCIRVEGDGRNRCSCGPLRGGKSDVSGDMPAFREACSKVDHKAHLGSVGVLIT